MRGEQPGYERRPQVRFMLRCGLFGLGILIVGLVLGLALPPAISIPALPKLPPIPTMPSLPDLPDLPTIPGR